VRRALCLTALLAFAASGSLQLPPAAGQASPSGPSSPKNPSIPAGQLSLSSQSSPSRSGKPAAVVYLYPEQVTVAANKPSPVELHFRVAPGLHINSHTPLTEDMIPTTLRLPEASGVVLARSVFPPGQDFTLEIDPSDKSQEKLSVYTGEFAVRAELVSPPGEHLVEATLRYQACDSRACMPPHSIPVVFDVIAK
jgi:hypothetical protein